MNRFVPIAAVILFATTAALAAEYGTADEAEALLERALAEVRADPSAAFAKFNDPQGGFQDRDLYVFCANVSDGKLAAHATPSMIGVDLRTIKDKNGKPFGAEMVDGPKEGEFLEIEYFWPRPNGTEPVDKISRVTRLGEQVCGVGYYKE